MRVLERMSTAEKPVIPDWENTLAAMLLIGHRKKQLEQQLSERDIEASKTLEGVC